MWTNFARLQYERLGRRYATGLTDGEFVLSEPFLPRPQRVSAVDQAIDHPPRRELTAAGTTADTAG